MELSWLLPDSVVPDDKALRLRGTDRLGPGSILEWTPDLEGCREEHFLGRPPGEDLRIAIQTQDVGGELLGGPHTQPRLVLQGSWGQVLGLPVWGLPSRTAGLGGQSTGCAK